MHGLPCLEPVPGAPSKSSLWLLVATVSLPVSPLTMRIWSPSVSPVTTTRRCAVLLSMVKTWIGIGGLVADDGVARHEDGGLAAGQQDARGGEHAGPQFALGIVEAGFQDEDARVGVHRGIDGGDVAGEIAVRDRRRRAP